jgi:hypothetical protein
MMLYRHPIGDYPTGIVNVRMTQALAFKVHL